MCDGRDKFVHCKLCRVWIDTLCAAFIPCCTLVCVERKFKVDLLEFLFLELMMFKTLEVEFVF